MSQKSSVPQAISFVSQVLKRDNRKYAKYWRGPLTARFIVFSNEVLKFRDETGALTERCMTFRMDQQFLGKRADTNLTEKLLAERSGILNLALDALDRLWERGTLIQPASGVELGERLRDQTSDIRRFVDQCCEVGPDAWATLNEPGCALYAAWKGWCTRVGITWGWTDNAFSEKLCAQLPAVRRSWPRSRPDGVAIKKGRVVLWGVGLRGKG
jgi:phage/plasmid-associated DNA primase